MPSLTIVRHGQSTYNLQNRFTGNLDVPLTTLGEEEAIAAGKKLQHFNYHLAYTSTLKRAQKTLEIILQEIHQTSVPIIKNASLNERMYGSLQGLNKAETTIKYGETQVEMWRRSYNARPPEGESLEDTFNRTVPYYKTNIRPQLTNGKTILIVAHGNSLRALMMYLENINSAEISKVNIPTGLPRVYTFGDGLKLINVRYL